MPKELKQLFTYFGCKKQIIERVWRAFGDDIAMTVEPFAGTAIVSVSRPDGLKLANMYLSASWTPHATSM